MKEFSRWVVNAETAFLQQVVAVLKMATESQRSETLGTLFAATSDHLLRRPEIEQVRQVSRASTAVQTLAASGARRAQWFYRLFPKKAFFPIFLQWEHVLAERSIQGKCSRKEQSSAVHSDSHGSIACFRGVGYMKSDFHDCCHHADLN